MWLLAALTPPKQADPDRDRSARLLHGLLLVIIGWFSLLLIGGLYLDPASSPRIALAGTILIGLSFASLALLRWGRWWAASNVFVFELWLTVTVMAVTGGGMATPAVPGYLLVILAAALLIGWGWGLASGLICLLTQLAITYAEFMGWLPPFQGARTPLTYLIVYTLISGMAAIFVYYFTARVQASLGLARQELAERKRAEEAIRKSERVLREAESLGHTGSWEHDLITGEIFYTEENRRIFFGDDRSKGAPFDDYAQAVHPDDREFLQRQYAQLVGEGHPGDIEYRVVWPDGSVHVIFGRATVVRDEAGRAIRIYGTNVDITERKRAEEEIKHQSARAETLTRIAARLNRQLELDAVIHAVCEEAISTFKASQATMSLYDKERELLVYAGGVNISPEYAAAIEPITRSRFDEFLRTMGPIMVVPDIQVLPDVPNAESASHQNMRTLVTAAMFRGQELVGALVVGVTGHVREFAQDELALLKAVSDLAAQAVANAQLFQAAHDQHEQLRALSAQLVEAQETERRAVARELHDEIGQLLYAVSANLEAVQISPEARNAAGNMASQLAESAELVDTALRQIRDLALELRPSMLDDFGLVPAVTWLVERQAQRAGFAVDFSAEPPDLRLPPALETTVYRIIQAALTNVARHAQARRVTVSVRRRASEVELLIHDDGVGFDVAAALARAHQGATLGLLSMQERVRLAGGTLAIDSERGHGMQIQARFPAPSAGEP
jgi:signal transduction histidine kinase/PAS domain-containing protein